VETGKPLYRAGEPIDVKLEASEQNLSLIVDATRESRVLSSQVVHLRNGHAAIRIPYSPEFKDEITIAAYANEGRNNTAYGLRTVLYPRVRDLKLDVTLNQANYRPGEEARADFHVLAPEGRAVESALGVVVFDKAVEERARTNQEFRGGYGFYDAFLAGDQLAGITRKDLDRVDLSKPLPEGLELVAEMLLSRNERYWPGFFGESDYETDARTVFGPVVEAQLRPIKEAL